MKRTVFEKAGAYYFYSRPFQPFYVEAHYTVLTIRRYSLLLADRTSDTPPVTFSRCIKDLDMDENRQYVSQLPFMVDGWANTFYGLMALGKWNNLLSAHIISYHPCSSDANKPLVCRYSFYNNQCDHTLAGDIDCK